MAHDTTNVGSSTQQVVAGIGNFAAAIVLWVSGLLTVFQGISVLSADKLTMPAPDYVYGFNHTAWGWIHIIVGVLVAAVAFGLFWSTTWARVSAIVIAALSIVSMFLWLPQYPVWSIVVIALDIFAIWAVANWDDPRTRASRMGGPYATESLGLQPEPASRWPEMSRWLGGLPAGPTLHSIFGGEPIRLEDGINDGRYEIRAELPGIDAAKDVDVKARDGVLTIVAQRRENRQSNRRSEFAYGSFVRSVLLPPGANADDISVTYAAGILTVSVGMLQARPNENRIHVASGT